MPNEHIAAAMARDARLDDRRRILFERAVMLACRENNVTRRESDEDGDRVVFETVRGEIRIVVDMFRTNKGRMSEMLDLHLYEYELLVFHVFGRRFSTDRARDRVSAKVVRYIESYWEAVIRHVS